MDNGYADNSYVLTANDFVCTNVDVKIPLLN